MLLGNSYIIIYFLFIIKYDHLLKLNLYYEPLFTSELIAFYLIDVMSRVLRYKSICMIMIWTYNMSVRIIIFKPGPVRSKAQVPGFDQVGWVNPNFKTNSKRRRFSKKKKSTGCNRVFDRVLPGRPGHTWSWLILFFINPVRFQPRIGRVTGRLAGPGRVSKLWLEYSC